MDHSGPPRFVRDLMQESEQHEILHGVHAHEHIASQKKSYFSLIFFTILNELTVHLGCRCTPEPKRSVRGGCLVIVPAPKG